MTDFGRVDDRLGGEDGRRRLTDAARRRGLGIVVDLVPNHMAVSLPANRWLWDVVEHGPSARYSRHFDIDWNPPPPATRGQVLLAILDDDHGGEGSESIELRHDGGRFTVHYRHHVLPASPQSVSSLLTEAAARAGSGELAAAARSLASPPPTRATGTPNSHPADARALIDLVEELADRPHLRTAIDDAVARVNGNRGELHRFLDGQNFRLCSWRTSMHVIGYRRFFDNDALIGLRVEDPAVFEESHAAVMSWLEAGDIDGLRVDHPDGLRRPGEYLGRLREAAPDAWIVVEKILEGDESLPSSWPVDGTTGYEFLNDVTALLIDPDGEDSLTALWNDIAESDEGWSEVAAAAKRDVLARVLSADLRGLAALFMKLGEQRRPHQDFDPADLSDALAETLIGFDVYRTYVTEEDGARPEDLMRIGVALDAARQSRPDIGPELFDLLGDALTAAVTGPLETELRERFQQLSGPVMAKGVEDTAFYRYLRLVATCEVGGDPGRLGYADVGTFHERCRHTQRERPATMLALSTHDTKRSEDVRARLVVLSEVPHRWAEAVRRWRRNHASRRPHALDGPTEYLIYQTLVGAHPLEIERLLPYLDKATKEAKRQTSWTDPDPAYEHAVAAFARFLDADPEFGSQLDEFVASIQRAGRINSLAQKTLQLTAPGVPDLYQGTELWDLSLVDPDNRRPVDNALRQRLLAEVTDAGPGEVLERIDEGLPKLWLTHKLLDLRRRRPYVFDANGTYRPLAVSGAAASHAVAYGRAERVVVVVPRLTIRLEEGGGWAETTVELPPGSWEDVLTGHRRKGKALVAQLLADFPVAILERIDR